MFAIGKLTITSQDMLRGRLFQYATLGMEYVGIDANGQRVMGVRDTE